MRSLLGFVLVLAAAPPVLAETPAPPASTALKASEGAATSESENAALRAKLAASEARVS